MVDSYQSFLEKLKQKSREELERLQEILIEERQELGQRPGSEGFALVNDSSLNLRDIVIEDLLEKKKRN